MIYIIFIYYISSQLSGHSHLFPSNIVHSLGYYVNCSPG